MQSKFFLLMAMVIMPLIAMERQKVKVPARSKHNDKAKAVLQHAGCAENNAKVQALLHAFEKMKADPELEQAQPSESDSLCEAGSKESLSPFGYVKHLWNSYHTSSKEIKKQSQENSQSGVREEEMRQNAQELVDSALDLFIDQQNANVTWQRRQKYAAMAGGFVLAAIGTLLSTYWGTICHQGS